MSDLWCIILVKYISDLKSIHKIVKKTNLSE